MLPVNKESAVCGNKGKGTLEDNEVFFVIKSSGIMKTTIEVAWQLAYLRSGTSEILWQVSMPQEVEVDFRTLGASRTTD